MHAAVFSPAVLKFLPSLPRPLRTPFFFPRYDVELIQRIEALVGLKLELYPTEQEAVLLLLERVGEAQRIATMQMKEADAKKKAGKRRGQTVDDADEQTGRAFKRKH